jgi:hypothetical protein
VPVWRLNLVEAQPNSRSAHGSTGLDPTDVTLDFRSAWNECSICRCERFE